MYTHTVVVVSGVMVVGWERQMRERDGGERESEREMCVCVGKGVNLTCFYGLLVFPRVWIRDEI